MFLVHRLALLIVLFGTEIYCQGGGGGGHGGGGGGSHGGSSHNGSGGGCSGQDCYIKLALIISFAVVGFLTLVIYLCYKQSIGRPLQSNTTFVNEAGTKSNERNADKLDHFQSGCWMTHYRQYGEWHGPSKLLMQFDTQSSSVTGNGSDDVGTFTIAGQYSKLTGRIGLTKTYQQGTGNIEENLGHRVIIQLKWNPNLNQFEGKWYTRTSKYRGKDDFQLKFKVPRNGLNSNTTSGFPAVITSQV